MTVIRTKIVCFADTLQVTGVLGPRTEVLVRPDREGLQITQVQVEPGDTVISGQMLARLGRPMVSRTAARELPVRAPAAGTVISSGAVVGAMASGRGQPLFRIAAQGEMELLADTPANTLSGLAPNQAAAVEIVGVGSLPGRVRLISTSINPTTQLGQVRVFVGSDPRLRAGGVRPRPDRHRRSAAARRCRCRRCCTGRAAPVVQVVRDGRIESRRVTVGLMAAGLAEIREGLSEGDIVVARAGAFLREGDRVRTVAMTETADQK